jgi:hypothetical protein
MVDCLTDNKTRTVADVRHAFAKNGGNLGTDGSVAFQFKHCGQFLFAPGTSEDKVMEAALEAGAEDVVTNDDGSVEVICAPPTFVAVKAGLEKAGLKAEVADITMKPLNETELPATTRRRCRSCSTPSTRSTTSRRSTHRRHGRGLRAVGDPPAPGVRILGIDPGLRITGFGVIEKGRHRSSPTSPAAASGRPMTATCRCA